MLWTPSPESYRGLPHKLKEGYDSVVRNLPQTKWIVKADDDTAVRVASLSTYLESSDMLTYAKPTIVGKIQYDGEVWQGGKWNEETYPGHDRYPPFPLGSCGHVVSRPVAEYIANRKAKSEHNTKGKILRSRFGCTNRPSKWKYCILIRLKTTAGAIIQTFL